MARVTKKIGLSLGADLCWPQCFEDIVEKLDLHLDIGGSTVEFDVERVLIEPFNLRKKVDYDVVVDRLTHWYFTSREWIKKAVILDGTYVFNNPWSVQSMEKQTTYCAMIRLGMPIPETIMVPPKEYDESADLRPTLERYAKLFDLGEIGKLLGYPLFMKPYDGGGWRGVSKIDNAQQLAETYDKSGKFLMHVQAGVYPYDEFVRCVGIGPQTNIFRYDPSAPLHDRYRTDFDVLDGEDAEVVRDTTLTINAFFNWDFNSCELLSKGGTWYPIDYANPCPDSQVTSLHAHFPWLVQAKIAWALFCAATSRPFRHGLDWQPFFEIAAEDRPYREKLRRYAELARERLAADRFGEFRAKHLPHLEEVVWEYFGTDRAKDAVRKKVHALYPQHEWDDFVELFWTRIQSWRTAQRSTS